MDLVSDPTLPKIFLGYSRESNPRLLGWQSNVLTSISKSEILIFKFTLVCKIQNVPCASDFKIKH